MQYPPYLSCFFLFPPPPPLFSHDYGAKTADHHETVHNTSTYFVFILGFLLNIQRREQSLEYFFRKSKGTLVCHGPLTVFFERLPNTHKNNTTTPNVNTLTPKYIVTILISNSARGACTNHIAFFIPITIQLILPFFISITIQSILPSLYQWYSLYCPSLYQ